MSKIVQVPPAPKQIPCKLHKDREAKYIVVPKDDKQPTLCCLDCKVSDQSNIGFIAIDQLNKSVFELYRHLKLSYNPYEYCAKYVLEQELIDKDEIDIIFQQLVENFVNEIKKSKTYLKLNIELYNKFIKQMKNDIEGYASDYRNELEQLKTILSQFDRSQDLQIQLEVSIEKLIKRIKKDQKLKNQQEFEKHQLYLKVQDYKKKQEYFLNTQAYKNLENDIKSNIETFQTNYLSKHPFISSDIANDQIERVFKEISIENDKELMTTAKKIISLHDNDEEKLIIKQRDVILNNFSLILIQTRNGEKICVYLNKQNKYKGFLFSLTKKNAIFKPKNQPGQPFDIIIPTLQNANLENAFFSIGQDLVINGNFQQCTSQLGGVYDISQHYIGDNVTFLANTQYFEIEKLEIWELKNELLEIKQEPPRFNHPNPNQGPPPQTFPPK